MPLTVEWFIVPPAPLTLNVAPAAVPSFVIVAPMVVVDTPSPSSVTALGEVSATEIGTRLIDTETDFAGSCTLVAVSTAVVADWIAVVGAL